MDTILKIVGDKILIGTEEGNIVEAHITDCDFMPRVGDDVRIYRADNELFVRKINNNSTYHADENADFTFRTQPIYEDNYNNYIDSSPKGTVNKWMYVLLAFLLGTFGIHKFYSKKIGLGFLYLIFFWTGIPSIIAFIEGVIALMATPDFYGNIVR